MEGKIERAEALWQNAQTQPDETNAWGFFSYGDAPPAIGGGVGSFAWFETRNQLLSFIRDVLPYAPPGSSDADWEKVEREVHEIARRAMEDEISVDRAVEDLNNALRTFSQIEWVGTLDDLIRGSHPFAERVRKQFWDLEESNSTGRQTISEEEMTTFRQFLAEYGI